MAAHLWSIIEAQQSRPRMSQPDSVGYAVGLLSWLLAAGVFVVVKGASDQLPPWTLCFWRVLLAALLLVPVVRGSFGDIRRFVTDRGIEALSIGAFGLGIAQGLAYTSLNYTSAVNFGIIFSTTPIMTLVLAAALLREPLGAWAGARLSCGLCRDCDDYRKRRSEASARPGSGDRRPPGDRRVGRVCRLYGASEEGEVRARAIAAAGGSHGPAGRSHRFPSLSTNSPAVSTTISMSTDTWRSPTW